MHVGKRSKSLKSRPPPAPETVIDIYPHSSSQSVRAKSSSPSVRASSGTQNSAQETHWRSRQPELLLVEAMDECFKNDSNFHHFTGSRKATSIQPPPPPPPPPQPIWTESLPSPQGPSYPHELPSQGSAESNPYISLDSPSLSPPSPPDYPPSPPDYLPSPPIRKKRYTFSRPPRSADTDLFMEALTEQLGQQLSVDDFLSPENDYEEVCDDLRDV